MIQQFNSREFIVFLMTGGVAALVNFISRIILNNWMSFSTAIIFAYIFGMLTAFVLAKIFVFKSSSQPLHQTVLFFIVVNLFAIAQTWLISMVMFNYFLPFLSINYFNDEISHAIGIAVPAFTSYIGHKHFTFKSSR